MSNKSKKQSENIKSSDLRRKAEQGDAPTYTKKLQHGIEPHEYQKLLMDTVKQALQAYDELVAEREEHVALRFKTGVDMVRSILHQVERKQSLPTDTQLTARTLVPFMPKEDQRPQIAQLRIRHAIIKREADLVAELSDELPCASCKYGNIVYGDCDRFEVDENWDFYRESTFDEFVSSIKPQHRMFLRFRDGRDLLDWHETLNGSCDWDDERNEIEGVGRWRRKTRFINGKGVIEVVAVETKDGKPIDQAA